MRLGDTPEGCANDQTPARMPVCPWRVVAVSVCGTSHEKTGQPCQDAHQWQTLPEDTLVVAVADGAGAAMAVQTAVDTLCRPGSMRQWPVRDADWQVLLTDVLTAAQTALTTEAATRQVKTRELATTLIVVVVTPTLVAAAQVGDGAAIVGDATGNVIALTSPESGEYINETTFLTTPEAVYTAQVRVWHGTATHLAAFSDGLQMLALKLPEGLPHAPFFAPLFRFVANAADASEAQAQLAAFLRSPRVRERTDDDVTLLLAARTPSLSSRG